MSGAWDGLRAPAGFGPLIKRERELFFRPMWENTLLPELRKLEREVKAEFGGEATFASAFEGLRLSALVDLGDGERRISLENRPTGAVFTLVEGRVVEGTALVSMDFAARRAVLRRAGREAVLNLESKQIEERGPWVQKVAALVAAHHSGVGSENVGWMTRALTHPRGLDGFGEDLIAAYDRDHADALAQAEAAPPPSPTEAAEPAIYPMLDIIPPTVAKVARTVRGSRSQGRFLQAAIHVRLGELGQAEGPPPAVPWSSEPAGAFVLTPREGGGFRLGSRYQNTSGKPWTYEFATPDAGFVRAP